MTATQFLGVPNSFDSTRKGRLDTGNLGRRIAVLERTGGLDLSSRVHSRIMRQALRHLSIRELECLEATLTESPAGKIHRDLTPEENDAVEASNRAIGLA
jgi:hypothetical protein